MNEIEKMYKLANVKPQYKKRIECKEGHPIWLPCGKSPCIDCDKSVFKDVMPPFTAEKQIAIDNIIFQCNFSICELQRTMPAEFTKDNKFIKHYFSWEYHAGDIGYYDETTEEPYGDWDIEYSNPDRKEALAGFVNALWQEHLTSEEKQQIKEILNG